MKGPKSTRILMNWILIEVTCLDMHEKAHPPLASDWRGYMCAVRALCVYPLHLFCKRRPRSDIVG